MRVKKMEGIAIDAWVKSEDRESRNIITMRWLLSRQKHSFSKQKKNSSKTQY